MKHHKILSCILAIFLFICLTPLNVRADIGPKPSVTITVDGVEDGVVYYATLLSEKKSTGPASAYDGNYARYDSTDEEYDIWKKFVEYEDSDGYYFLQEFWECSGSDSFRWGYFPPTPFKILLYFPEYDSFAVSNIYNRYAFDTYYAADLEGVDIRLAGAGEELELIRVRKNYDYTWEIVSLLARIVLTILVELVIALLFGLRKKNQLLFLTVCNVLTQVALNVLLNVINYNKGQWAFTFYYVLMEFAVFAIEAVAYKMVLQTGTKRLVAYAFVANAVSFVIGLWLAHIIPGIF